MNVGTPYEFNLELAAGFTSSGATVYSKDALGRVLLHIDVSKDSVFVSGETIATMPEGFRVKRKTDYNVFVWAGISGYIAAAVTLQTNGNIVIGGSGAGYISLRGTLTYITAQ